jgi:hypothetical protein
VSIREGAMSAAFHVNPKRLNDWIERVGAESQFSFCDTNRIYPRMGEEGRKLLGETFCDPAIELCIVSNHSKRTES